MPIRLSRYFDVEPSELKARGVFDGHLGIDNKLFVDPKLLKKTLRIPEFSGARKDITKYFSQVIKLLKASKEQGDIAWIEAERRMRFKEENGASLGYGKAGSYGRAVGPQLARSLAKRAKEILELGVDDPEMFELIGLFQEDVGADLLSDMAVSILKPRFLSFTQRVTEELELGPSKRFLMEGRGWKLPLTPDGKRALVLVPKAFLSKLPVALDRSEIDEVAQFNAGVRRQWNAMVAAARKDKADPSKDQIREMLFADPKNLVDLIRVYRESPVKGYDFEKDVDGLLNWDSIGRSSARANPLDIPVKHPTNLSEVRTVVDLILKKFKKNVEENRLYEFLYRDDGKPKHEVFAQRLFYAVADAYCEANNVDLSREPNAGNGPVDFKLSKGYSARILVEVKKSSNSDLVNGFVRQLPEYEKSESTDESVYLVVRVTKGDASIKSVMKLRDKRLAEGKKVPAIFVVDGRRKDSASKHRKRSRRS
ncbi:MAG: hypothetical protein ABSG02_19795 [Terriglobales bacterium]